MNTYTIENTTSGHVIGDFAGETADHAIAAMLRDAGYSADVVDGEIVTDCPNWNDGANLAATECESSEIIAIAHRDIVDGTTVTTAYNDIAPVYGESRAYAALDADDREWWDATLTRMHAVAVAAARFPAKARDRIIHAGSDGDLEAAIGAQESTLAAELGTTAGALFAQENPGEVLDPSATDWDATAWETDRVGFSAAQRAVLWPVYQAALVAETVRLATTRRPMSAAEQGEHDAEQRAHEAVAAGQDGAEWQSEADAVDGWGEYAATAASHLNVPESERAAWCDAYETAARETARRMYRDAQS